MGSKVNGVIVLMPNGRRETLKVNLDHSVLQILEEVCSKNGLNSDEYSLRHHNTILDPTTVIRFTSLPNNAFLEMVPAKRSSVTPSNVILSLQIEGGTERLTGEFTSDASLEKILAKLFPDMIVNTEKIPVIVYMRREIVGLDAMRVTTLRSLGLTGGRALLRLMTRDTMEHPELQCTGATTLSRTSIQSTAKSTSSQLKQTAELAQKQCRRVSESVKPTFESQSIPAAEIVTAAQLVSSVISEAHSTHRTSAESPKTTKKSESPSRPRSASRSKSPSPSQMTVSQPSSVQMSDININPEDIKYLDERNGLVFQLENANSASFHHDVPDSFFDITVDDVRLMMRDLKRNRESMENAPLQTEAFRQMQMDGKTNIYLKTVIRIQFPDRLILQGVFQPNETVEDVAQFVKRYLINSKSQFYLYTSPPKRELPLDKSLFELECVPCVKMYFAYSAFSDMSLSVTNQQYLKENVKQSMTTQKVAAFAACLVRGVKPSGENKKRQDDRQTLIGGTINNRQEKPTVSVEQNRHNNQTPNNDVRSPQQLSPSTSQSAKVPKWFKPV